MSGLEAGSGWMNPNPSKCEVKWFWIDGLQAKACAPSKRAVGP